MLKATFDGDSYLVTLPPLDAMIKLKQMEQTGRYHIPFQGNEEDEVYLMTNRLFDNYLVHSSLDLDHQLRYLADPKGKLQPIGNMAIKSGGTWQPSGLLILDSQDTITFGFRPCLIPLGKDDVLNMDAVPGIENGWTVTGGTFWYDENTLDWSNPVLYKPGDNRFGDFFFSARAIDLRDSIIGSNANLSWVYIDGILICTQILLDTTISQMANEGLLDSDPGQIKEMG